MSEPPVTASGDTEVAYSYRPSVLGAGWQFRLAPDGVVWDIGRKSGRAFYSDIRHIRMSYRPAATQNHRFVTEVWVVAGVKLTIASTSWKSLVEQERLDAAYKTFVVELHRRVARDSASVMYEAGGRAVKYWIGVTLFAGVAFGLAALIVRAIQLAAWGGAAFIVLFLAVFLWQAGNYFRRNRPMRYRADALPADLLP